MLEALNAPVLAAEARAGRARSLSALLWLTLAAAIGLWLADVAATAAATAHQAQDAAFVEGV